MKLQPGRLYSNAKGDVFETEMEYQGGEHIASVCIKSSGHKFECENGCCKTTFRVGHDYEFVQDDGQYDALYPGTAITREIEQ